MGRGLPCDLPIERILLADINYGTRPLGRDEDIVFDI